MLLMLKKLILLFCISLANGSDIWGFEEAGNANVIAVNENGVYVGGELYEGLNRAFVTKISKGGHRHWQYIGELSSKDFGYMQANQIGFSASGDDVLFVGISSVSPYVGKLNDSNGNLLWKQDNFAYDANDDDYWTFAPSVRLLAVTGDSEGAAYAIGPSRTYASSMVYKLSSSTGDILWAKDIKNTVSYYSRDVFDEIAFWEETNEVEVFGNFFSNSDHSYFRVSKFLDPTSGNITRAMVASSSYDSYRLTRVKYDGDKYRIHGVGQKKKYGKKKKSERERSENNYVVQKNSIKDGHYFLAMSATTSVSAECEGGSWSRHRDYDEYSQYKITCDYYYARGDTLTVTLVFVLIALALWAICEYFQFGVVVRIGSVLSTCSWTADFAFLLSSVFFRRYMFLLSLFFLLLPFTHFLTLVYFNTKNRSLRQLFSPPSLYLQWIGLSSRDGGVPYLGETRLLPHAVNPSEECLILVVCWIGACCGQLGWAVIWLCAAVVQMLPWLLVHVPVLSVYFAIGYLLYVFGIYSQPGIKPRWLKLMFKKERTGEPCEEEVTSVANTTTSSQDLKDGTTPLAESIVEDVQWEQIISFIFILFLSFIPQIIVQGVNQRRVHHKLGSIAILSIVSKGLFALNLMNRISILYGTSFVAMLQYSIQRMRPTAESAFAALESFDPSDMLGFLSSSPNDQTDSRGEVELPATARTDDQIRNEIRDLQLQIQRLEDVLLERERGNSDKREDIGRKRIPTEPVSTRQEGVDSSLHLEGSHRIIGLDEVSLHQEGKGGYEEYTEDDYEDEVAF